MIIKQINSKYINNQSNTIKLLHIKLHYLLHITILTSFLFIFLHVNNTNNKLSSANGGFSTNKGTSYTKQTNLTTITANKINANIKGNTYLKGALLASGEFNKEGSFIGNKQLNLQTNSLTFENLSNTNMSSNINQGINANINLTPTTKLDKNNKQIQTLNPLINSTIGMSSHKQNKATKTKTLATLGKGNIVVASIQKSDNLLSLNRDTTNLTKEIYSSNTKTSVDAKLDTNVLTKQGRDKIREDATKTGLLFDAVDDTLTTSSTSLLGDRPSGVKSFFDNVKDKVNLFEGIKSFVNNPANAYAKELLSNPNASAKENRYATQILHNEIAKKMNIPPREVAIILDKYYKGFTPKKGDKTFIAGNLQDNKGDFANTAINETSDIADAHRDKDIVKNDKYKDNKDEYSENFGKKGEDLLDLEFTKTGGIALTNIPHNQVDTNLKKPEEISSQVIANTQVFNALDKANGAHRQLNKQEISFIKNNAIDYAKKKYKTDNPTPNQIQGATHQLAQAAVFMADESWAKIIKTVDKDAKTYLLNNVDSLKNISNIEKANFALNLADIANDKESISLYKQYIHSKDQISLNDIIQNKIEKTTKDTIQAIDTIKEQGAKKTINNLVDNSVELIKNTSWEDVKNYGVKTLETIVAQGGTAVEVTELTPNQIASVYNISLEDAQAVKGAALLTGILTVGGAKAVFDDTLKLGVGGVKGAVEGGKNIVGNVKNSGVMDSLKVTIPTSATHGGFICKGKICENGIELKPTSSKQKELIDYIVTHGDKSGDKTESLINTLLDKTKYKKLDGGKYNGNAGFDHVIQDKKGEIIIILDSKQISKQGSVQLSGSGAKLGENKTNQLSSNWIEAVVKKLEKTPSDPVYKALIKAQENDIPIKTAVVGVDKTNSKIVLVPVNIPNKIVKGGK